jgi:hypothetical protein
MRRKSRSAAVRQNSWYALSALFKILLSSFAGSRELPEAKILKGICEFLLSDDGFNAVSVNTGGGKERGRETKGKMMRMKMVNRTRRMITP